VTGPADPQRAAALVRQHAETSRLFGVDFVPAYRAGTGTMSARRSATVAEVAELKPLDDGPTRAIEAESERDAADSRREETTPVASDGTAQERLDALRERYIADAPHDRFETDHTSIVFGEGDPAARLMFVGEAPGADEDRLGRPFVGKSGQLLEKMIVAMGLSRESVYIANVLKTRPPGNRTPTIEEARLCAPYLYEQIRIIAPEVIVTLGKSAGQLLLGTADAMGAMRGKWAEFPPPSPLVPVEGFTPVAVMPTYHPAFLLRSYTPENRAKVWGDLNLVMDRLGLG
jgi:uracil-DNA glycosylase family 4